jgi:heavy metal translocating P-type ATPase
MDSVNPQPERPMPAAAPARPASSRPAAPTPPPPDRPPPAAEHPARGRLVRGTVLVPAAVALFLAAGAVLRLAFHRTDWGDAAWMAGLALTALPVVWRTLRGMARGQFASDVVAMLAVLTAVALRQPFAGLIVVLMQTGGESLERYAEGRASRAVRELEEAAPRRAHRMDGRHVHDVDADDVRVGDRLLVRPGELVPCDGVVEEGRSHVDASRLTGEPIPVRAEAGSALMSGSVNGEGALVVRATAISRESRYARIVELVRSAQASKAPLQRLADRYAVWFTPATLLVCLAAWYGSGDALRVLAVLVVATPCPLILATPVAVIGGIDRAARRQVVVRSGGALEQLAGITVAAFDKTGTLTVGMPRVSRIVPAAGFDADEVLRLAAAVEVGSSHLLARTAVEAAADAGLAIPPARHVVETPGRGVSGNVEGRAVIVGSLAFALMRAPGAEDELRRLHGASAGLRALVAVDGRAAGAIEYADRLRPGTDRLFASLKMLGVRRTLLLSGDSAQHTAAIAREAGIAEARGDLLPEDKVAAVRGLVESGEKVLMVGDGTNDAPALSAATVGIAMAGHGGGITAEAADAVVLVDDLDRVAEALAIGRRTLRIARQSIWAGLGLSGVAMLFAAAGHVPPAAGALLQEAIDVAVIINALRTSR